ncbi:hypothetical protein [Bradyrhizobium sp. CB3481]|uniref:hypothetical protein n=1 Tax=Bradyrhizobium sp. CB3481 TaxID=3039158 RepID=UPI0024B0A6A1|nr:hypothetical protein [Bradyrhizobium sp. CB3481]WFU16406.1 hypothetical protein QA643_36610 [Bradyrhizobium sp. CB3481]
MTRVAVAILAAVIGGNAASAQTTAESADKQDTACTTTSPSATTGHGEEKTPNSQTVGQSAVLPDAGGANSAARTVWSGNKPLKVSPDCPPDSTPK